MIAQRTQVTIRPLAESDVPAADRVLRLAFGTLFGLPDPLAFMGDADAVGTRLRSPAVAAFVAEREGELVGSSFVTNWGSVGVFGPLTIAPRYWDAGIGSLLTDAAMRQLADWGVRHCGLFTGARSPKHLHLYQKFGFWPRVLTALLSKPAAGGDLPGGGQRYSTLDDAARDRALDEARALTGAVYNGLDLSGEIRAVAEQSLGDTLLLRDGDTVVGLAVCHYGAGTEAGSGTCYVKFGAVLPGPAADGHFARLVDACEALAVAAGVGRLSLGMNLAREAAYQTVVARGYRTDMLRVAMHRPNEPVYNRADRYVIDDWR